ncbi:MAG: FAD-binding protein, partial [Clostridium sp.]|nr:FAD-binding protein [Clostridium sp.]
LIDNLNADENIEVLLNSPATELAVEGGEVIGAFIEKDGGETILIKANNTILATSGFAANKEMLEEYIPEMLDAYPYVAPGATGEGIIWGQNLGADVANMKSYQGHGVYSEELKGSVDLNVLYRGGMLVNKEGQRFTDEHKGYSELSPEVLSQPTGHVFMVFNQENADNTPRFEEFDDAGIIIKADTFEDLAAKLELDKDNFNATIEDFKNGIEKGQDSLNRTLFPENFDGPYYAIDITADLRHTQGGLVTDIVGHVLKSDGSLIKGLYAAGGVMEGFSDTAGPGYMSGNGLLQAFVFGRLAGEYAATTSRDDATIVEKEFD